MIFKMTKNKNKKFTIRSFPKLNLPKMGIMLTLLVQVNFIFPKVQSVSDKVSRNLIIKVQPTTWVSSQILQHHNADYHTYSKLLQEKALLSGFKDSKV